jgi:hypothetical protein
MSLSSERWAAGSVPKCKKAPKNVIMFLVIGSIRAVVIYSRVWTGGV